MTACLDQHVDTTDNKGERSCPGNDPSCSSALPTMFYTHRRLAETATGARVCDDHTPSLAFRHLPPNSARTGYAAEGALHTPSIAFRHRPPYSARIGYAAEGALHTPSIAFRHLPPYSAGTGYAAQSTLHLRAACPPSLWAPSERVGLAFKHARKHKARPTLVNKEFRVNSNDVGFVCAGVGYAAWADMKETPNVSVM